MSEQDRNAWSNDLRNKYGIAEAIEPETLQDLIDDNREEMMKAECLGR